MKSEHRHELKTNELAQWIVDFPEWAKTNSKMIIYVSAAVIAIAGAYFWITYDRTVSSARKQAKLTDLLSQLSQNRAQIVYSQTQGIDASYMLIRTADELQTAAQDTQNESMAALAMIKQAEALRTELHYRPGAMNPKEVVAQIDQAATKYRNAAAKCMTNPSLLAMSQLGIGLCAEELGNFDQAGQIYNDIAANTYLEGTVAAAQAKTRLAIMAEYQQEVIFGQAAKAKEAKILEPQIKFEDSNIPPAESNQAETPDINLFGQ